MSHRGTLTALLGIALACRILVAALTAIPGRDAAHYLWMAEQTAGGRPGALFETVFHPGYPLLVALPIAVLPGVDPFRLAQAVSLTCGAMAILPLHAVTRRLYDDRAAFWAALLYAVGTWFCRHPADALSEGPFYLCVALWAERLTAATGRARPLTAGVLAALAYALRPEGAALVVIGAFWLWKDRRPAGAAWTLAGFLPCAAPLPVCWSLAGHGFSLTPKAAFNYEVGVGQASGGGIGHYLTELVRLPGAALEDLGFLVLPVAVAGAICHRADRGGGSFRNPRTLLLAPILLQCLVIPALRAHYRFVSGFGILLLPFAGAAAAWLRALPGRRRLVALGLVLLVGSEAARLPHPRRHDRIVLRDLGRFVGGQLRPGEAIATDMPRLAYYAGVLPPPPRPIAADEILALAEAPATRFVVVVQGRTPLPPGALAALSFQPVTLPPGLRELAERRDVLLFERR